MDKTQKSRLFFEKPGGLKRNLQRRTHKCDRHNIQTKLVLRAGVTLNCLVNLANAKVFRREITLQLFFSLYLHIRKITFYLIIIQRFAQ